MRLFHKRVFFTKDQFEGSQFSIGEFTYGTPDVRNYDFKTKLNIGKYCSFAAKVSILLGGEHRFDMATTFPFAEIPEAWPETEILPGMTGSKGDITIGNDVWIGHGATILSGVSIGDGAVIGASALVCRDIAPYSIAGGNPAKTIKMRFDNETISRLINLAWWDWPEEKVRSNIHLICNPDVESLLDTHGC